MQGQYFLHFCEELSDNLDAYRMDADGLMFALLYTPAKTVIRKLGGEFLGSIFGQSSLNAALFAPVNLVCSNWSQ
jgi:hypothetical protein